METTDTPYRVMEIQDQKIELQGATLLHLNEIRKWTNFLSILGFVGFGLLLVIGIVLLFASSLSSMAYNPYNAVGPWIGVAYIMISIIYFFPILYLFEFSRYAKHSLVQINSAVDSNQLMAQAFSYLKKHFRFMGICTIVLLVIYVLIIIGVLIVFMLR